MANKKTPTIKEQFAEILEQYPLSPAHREFIEGRIEVLDRKSTDRKPTAKQVQNAEIAEHAQILKGKDHAFFLGVQYQLVVARKTEIVDGGSIPFG
jgi:hypothetical protein